VAFNLDAALKREHQHGLLGDIVDAPTDVIFAVERHAILGKDKRPFTSVDEFSAHRGEGLGGVAGVDQFDETRIASATAENLRLEHAGRIEQWRLIGADEARIAGNAKTRAMEKVFSVRLNQSHEGIPDNLNDAVMALTLEF
jgi:hypothetical protein